MDAASFVISILTLIFTAAIPAVIYVLGRRGERITHAILSQQHQLLSAQRLDHLAAQAEQMNDPQDLREILEEAKGLTKGRSLDRIVESYWRNSQVPLCGSVLSLDSRGALITARCLNAKLAGMPAWEAMREVTAFVQAAENAGADFSSIAPRFADWIFSRFAENDRAGDMQIRELLNVSPASIFIELLNPLDNLSRYVSVPARVNILGGVCLAYLDRIDFFPKGEKPIAETSEKSARNRELSSSLAISLASLLHRGRLRDLAQWDPEGCTLPPDSCAALVIAVAGAVSFCSSHLAMRALKNISGMHVNTARLGTSKGDFEFGIAKFAEYHQELLDQYL